MQLYYCTTGIPTSRRSCRTNYRIVQFKQNMFFCLIVLHCLSVEIEFQLRCSNILLPDLTKMYKNLVKAVMEYLDIR